jgi:hypothetical protein
MAPRFPAGHGLARAEALMRFAAVRVVRPASDST